MAVGVFWSVSMSSRSTGTCLMTSTVLGERMLMTGEKEK
jgi:hypothetical protein